MWLIVLGTIVAGGVAFLISSNTTPVYQSSSRLLIDEAPGAASGNEYSQVLLEQRLTLTYIELLKTRPVLEEVIERAGLSINAGQLASRITVSAPQETQIIVITVEDPNPQRAADIANTLGTVFIDQTSERESLRYAEPIANWEERQAEVADEIEALETEINRFQGSEAAEDQAALSRLETKLQEAQIRYTEGFNNLNDLQVAQAKESSNVIQIEPAQARSAPFKPRVLRDTLSAAVVGGLLAVGIVFLIEYLDDTVKSPDQIAEATGLSTLGAIALIDNQKAPDNLITQRAPRDPISEAYRVLRTNLGFAAVDGELKSMLVTSASPGEGKSTTASNLAMVMSQTGRSVILVDGDMRRPSLHRFFDLANNHGLSTAAYDRERPVVEHVVATKFPRLSLMTSGPIPPNPAELLNSQRMAQVLDELRSEADMVIIDTPPALTVADATILAPQVDGCVVVIEAGRTRRDTFVQAVERLRNSNAQIFGAVINLLKPRRSGYYYYYYDYYYSHDHSYDDRGRRKRRSSKQTRLPAWLASLARR
jgi:non-specific protein-tyrosine kinase